MAVDVTTRIAIARPRHEVADFAADPDRAPAWYSNLKWVEWRTQPPLRTGSQIAFVADVLGRRLSCTYEVVAFAPGERVVMRTTEGPFPMETTYSWESTADGHTRMTLRKRGEPRGFSRLATPFLSLAIRRANARDLALLKAILEHRAGRGRLL